MSKGKEFYGGTVTDAIAEACKAFSASQEELEIEILETGSSGIFGLCRKKAHIRVARREEHSSADPPADAENRAAQNKNFKEAKKEENASGANRKPAETAETTETVEKKKEKQTGGGAADPAAAPPPELPSDEVLAGIQEDITTMVELMGFPSAVTVTLEEYTVACRISDAYQEELVGRDGRVVDSLQYLLRKMMSRRLPERIMLSLDVGNYRESRAEELKERALELAAQVREDGKTRAVPALNPSERRVVHMTLQDDKTIRSRSVGDGLFKKVLIYKPGRKRSGPRKGKGKGLGNKGQRSERSSDSK
ncbi:MAG: protein jag [Candidatus Electrothrix sp. YB6]